MESSLDVRFLDFWDRWNVEVEPRSRDYVDGGVRGGGTAPAGGFAGGGGNKAALASARRTRWGVTAMVLFLVVVGSVAVSRYCWCIFWMA